MFLGSRRLSGQLWASHLTVVVITLVALVGALVLLAGGWLLRQGLLLREPAIEAQTVSTVVGNLVRRGVPEPRISELLADLQAGSVQVPSGPLGAERSAAPFRPSALHPDLENLEYLAVVTPDGNILASSDRARFPPGSPFSAAASAQANAVLGRALAGEREPARLSSQQSGETAVGASAIVADGRPVAVVVLAKQVSPPQAPPFLLLRGLAVFGVGTLVVLTLSSVFALTFSGLAAYLLSRRLGRRLDDLSRAADAVAGGDLAARVAPGAPDEVGRLAERFNTMAERLQASIAALEVEKQRVEESLRTRRELMANVSHELRTPLALLRGHVESLAMGERGERESGRAGERELATDERRRYLEIIEAEVDHLSRLIDDLFALATTESGALPLELEPLDPAELIAEAVEAIRPIARRERQVTVVNGVEEALPSILADRRRFVQVLNNLLRNALHYTPEGGLVSVSAALEESRNGRAGRSALRILVADTGLGIPPEALPHIFDRFYRADPARDRTAGGAGLGLAIVREFVEAMEGQVAVESTPGEGSRFSFTLPVAP